MTITLEDVQSKSKKAIEKFEKKAMSDKLRKSRIREEIMDLSFIETGIMMFEKEWEKGNYLTNQIVKNEKNPVDLFRKHICTRPLLTGTGYICVVRDKNSGLYKLTLTTSVGEETMIKKGELKVLEHLHPFEFEIIFVKRAFNLKMFNRFFNYAFFDKVVSNPYRKGQDVRPQRSSYYDLTEEDVQAIRNKQFPSYIKSFFL